VGVEVAEGESAAVEEHGDRVYVVVVVRPVDPHRDGPGRPVDPVILHPHRRMQRPAGQIPQPPAGLMHTLVDAQLERHRFQYFLQDVVNRRFGHTPTVQSLPVRGSGVVGQRD
jgi:hypothetical protein